jgi:hypothetical protein
MTRHVQGRTEYKNGTRVITGKAVNSSRTPVRVAYDKKHQTGKNSFFPATPFDAQSLAGTGALVFEGEMIGGGN